MSLQEKIRLAQNYVRNALASGLEGSTGFDRESHINDAANIFAENKDEYQEIYSSFGVTSNANRAV